MMTTTTSTIIPTNPRPLVALLLGFTRRLGTTAGPRMARATYIPLGRAGTDRHA